MSLLIQKYGGKSLATPEDVKQVARLILGRVDSGAQVVIVVSAMADTTDRYTELARAVNPKPAGRELDVLLSVGERISIAMLALALNGLREGIAVSLTGAQAGIITDTVHNAARIVEIRPLRVREVLDEGRIPVIAGYQGITTDKNISTLGRGGTDATAVGLAIALGADRVEFMKDVDGISSADPKVIPTAKIIDRLSYEEALELMGCGAKILQAPAVEMAAEHKIPLAVGSSKTGVAGTIVTEKPLVRQHLTAVQLVENVVCISGLAPLEFSMLLDNLRESGLAPLTSFRHGDRCAITLRADELDLLPHSLHSGKVEESFDLLTLLGPGLTSNNELARALREILQSFDEFIEAQSATTTRLSLLLRAGHAATLAARAHELCIKLPTTPAASTPT